MKIETRAKRISADCENIYKSYLQIERSIRAFSSERAESHLSVYRVNRAEISQALEDLKKQAEGNRSVSTLVGQIVSEGEIIMSVAESAVEKLKGGSELSSLTGPFASLQPHIDNIFRDLKELRKLQNSTLSLSPERQQENRKKQRFLLGWGLCLSTISALLVTLFFLKFVTARLSVIVDNTARFERGHALSEPLVGTDEIAMLDARFHEMAEQIIEIKRKERTVVDHAFDIICSVDGGNRILSISPSCLRHWGFEPDELIGRRLIDVVAEESRQPTVNALAALQQINTGGEFESSVLTKMKSVVSVQWSGQWMPEEACFYFVVHDISERVELERMKKDFIGMVSHDLKTPLTSLSGFMELMAMGSYGALPVAVIDRTRRAENSLRRLIRLINNLLDLEKLEEGKMQLTLIEQDIYQLVEMSIDAISEFARSNSINVLNESESVVVSLDADQIIQVLVNLLSNAVKFSPKGADVKVSTTVDLERLVVSIQDNGRGVPQELHAEIFTRYKQVLAADGKSGRGTGLGLPICKRIIENHGGQIGLESVPGKGSTFWFSLPIAKEASTD
ncbi:MAG: PAS domain-containing sensor histidine kinase [Leptolyngbya sp.]|nr:PAS domain-containing sensor histidine kinase [Candidatus Melainabacteria bacterium]